jgi:hypothetical protein
MNAARPASAAPVSANAVKQKIKTKTGAGNNSGQPRADAV